MRLVLALFAATAAFAGDGTFTIAGMRVLPESWNKEANFAKIDRWAREAKARGADVVMTPEGFLEGYVGNQSRGKDLEWEKYREKYLSIGEPIDGPILRRARSLAEELKIYLLVGFAESRDGRMYNSVVVFSPQGGIVTHYSKTHTANDEPFNTKGTEFPVVSTPLGRWGALICMDRQLPETSRILALKGAQIILVPAWGMYSEMNDIMMRTRAYENGVWVAFVHPKRALFIDPSGKIIAQDQGDQDQLVLARIRLGDEKKGPIRFRRPELYNEILK